MPRLRRSDPAGPGLTRRRRGRGFQVLDARGRPVTDPATIQRVHDLRIPPAWHGVWICGDARGHLQATGIDAAGRRQYLYHPDWHAQRARRKYAEMETFARALPDIRERVGQDAARAALDDRRVLAVMVRLLDRGFFRIGCEDYAERNGTYGLATMRKEHVKVVPEEDVLVFDFPAKHGRRRVQHVVDPASAEVVAALKRRRGGGPELFAYLEQRRWRDVKSAQVNAYLKEVSGLDISAKDFRTWNATVLAAVAVAVASHTSTAPTARKRAAARAVKEVARYLGNTPAVCRASYIDPRVLDRFLAGVTIDLPHGAPPTDPDDHPIQPAVERAVLELLADA